LFYPYDGINGTYNEYFIRAAGLEFASGYMGNWGAVN
jgi:hypothetical protein